jgi:hypothetical protein
MVAVAKSAEMAMRMGLVLCVEALGMAASAIPFVEARPGANRFR